MVDGVGMDNENLLKKGAAEHGKPKALAPFSVRSDSSSTPLIHSLAQAMIAGFFLVMVRFSRTIRVSFL